LVNFKLVLTLQCLFNINFCFRRLSIRSQIEHLTLNFL
jgi:hypothetical protein